MSNPDRRQDYLERMGAAARQIQSYAEGFDKDAFLAYQKTQDAVIMKLLVIGESPRSFSMMARPSRQPRQLSPGGK